jgi:hypothetical protein
VTSTFFTFRFHSVRRSGGQCFADPVRSPCGRTGRRVARFPLGQELAALARAGAERTLIEWPGFTDDGDLNTPGKAEVHVFVDKPLNLLANAASPGFAGMKPPLPDRFLQGLPLVAALADPRQPALNQLFAAISALFSRILLEKPHDQRRRFIGIGVCARMNERDERRVLRRGIQQTVPGPFLRLSFATVGLADGGHH